MSHQVSRDLGPFFQLWGVPASDAARATAAQWPVWIPAEMFDSAPNCKYALTLGADVPSGKGGVGTVKLETGGSCLWTATSDAPWLALKSAAGGIGPATIQYSARANDTGYPRTAVLTIGGRTVNVTQLAPAAGN